MKYSATWFISREYTLFWRELKYVTKYAFFVLFCWLKYLSVLFFTFFPSLKSSQLAEIWVLMSHLPCLWALVCNFSLFSFYRSGHFCLQHQRWFFLIKPMLHPTPQIISFGLQPTSVIIWNYFVICGFNSSNEMQRL